MLPAIKRREVWEQVGPGAPKTTQMSPNQFSVEEFLKSFKVLKSFGERKNKRGTLQLNIPKQSRCHPIKVTFPFSLKSFFIKPLMFKIFLSKQSFHLERLVCGGLLFAFSLIIHFSVHIFWNSLRLFWISW